MDYQSAKNADTTGYYDFVSGYVGDLENVLDIDAIRDAGVHIGADPSAARRWPIGAPSRAARPGPHRAEHDGRPGVAVHDPGLGRQDPDGLLVPYVMASVVAKAASYDIATGNDADATGMASSPPMRG